MTKSLTAKQINALEQMDCWGDLIAWGGGLRTLRSLADRGLTREVSDRRFTITESGQRRLRDRGEPWRAITDPVVGTWRNPTTGVVHAVVQRSGGRLRLACRRFTPTDLDPATIGHPNDVPGEPCGNAWCWGHFTSVGGVPLVDLIDSDTQEVPDA